MLGKGIPFGVRKHEIKHEPRKKKKNPDLKVNLRVGRPQLRALLRSVNLKGQRGGCLGYGEIHGRRGCSVRAEGWVLQVSPGPKRGKCGHWPGPLGLLAGISREDEAGGGKALEEDDKRENG